jgi:hypothetical protein
VEFLFPLAANRLEVSAQYVVYVQWQALRPSLEIEKAFVAFVRGQSDEVGFEMVPQPWLQYPFEFWTALLARENAKSEFAVRVDPLCMSFVR